MRFRAGRAGWSEESTGERRNGLETVVTIRKDTFPASGPMVQELPYEGCRRSSSTVLRENWVSVRTN